MTLPSGETPREPPARDTRSSAAWYLTSTFATAAVPLLALPFITRALTPEEYGAWVLAFAFAATANAFANVGLPTIYERSYFESAKEGRTAALLWTTLLFVTGALGFALLGTWAWRESLAAAFMHGEPQPALLFWTTCAAGAASLKVYFLVYLRNAGEARRHALYTLQESLLGALASVLLVAWWQVGPLGLAWGPLAASLIVLAQLCAHFAKRLPLELAWQPLRESLRLAFPLLPRVALGVFGQVFDKWLVGAVAATGGVAAYAIGQRLAYGVFTFSTALENVFQPRTYRLMFDSASSGAAIGKMLTPYVYATVGVALAAGLLAHEALWILAPGSYAGAAAVTGVLVVYFAVLFFGKQPQLLYAKKTVIVSALSSASILLNALAIWVLATRYGALGAAAGTAIAGTFTTAVFVAVSQRYYRIDYEWPKLLLMYAWLIVALVIVQWVLTDVAYPVLLAAKAGLLAGYACIGMALGYWRILLRGARPDKAVATES